MKKKGFLLTSLLFGAAVIILGILVGIKLITEGPDQTEKKSDEYIKYSEMFQLELSSDKSYYSILKLKDTSITSVEIPDTIDNIPVKKLLSHKDSKNFSSYNNCITFRIGKNIEYIGSDPNNDGILKGGTLGDGFLGSLSKVSTIIVDENNSVYASKDGVLYNKDLTVLIRYPNNKVDSAESFNVLIPNTVKEIYNKAFYYNTKITKVVLGNDTVEIGNMAFLGCNKLTTVVFNNKLEILGQSAFKNCDLTSVKLPNTVKSIGDLCFAYNKSLDYCFIGNACKTFGNDIFFSTAKAFTIATSSDNLETLKNVLSLKNYNIRIDD